MASSASPVLITLATLCLVLAGLLLNLVTAAFPLCLWLLQPPVQRWYYAVPVFLVQATHLWLLWVDPGHVAAYRFLTLALRRQLLPLVMYLVKMEEAIKHQEDVACLKLDNNEDTINQNSSDRDVLQATLQSFRPSVRRRYKNVFKTFQSQGIVVQSIQAERNLDLRATLPLIWAHQKRQCQADGRNIVEAFVKRFLVVSVVPDGVLDLFYNHDRSQLLAFQMGMRQGAVYHWFMYFSKDQARQSGIWFYGILLSLVRAKQCPGVQWFNALTHLLDSKQMAGLHIVSYQDEDTMNTLFPWEPTVRMPDTALNISLLDATTTDNESSFPRPQVSTEVKETKSTRKKRIS